MFGVQYLQLQNWLDGHHSVQFEKAQKEVAENEQIHITSMAFENNYIVMYTKRTIKQKRGLQT